MINDTVKLELRGDIQIDVFSEAVRHFSELVVALSKDIAGQDTIEWELDTLEYGSPAVLTWQGHSDDVDIIENVVGAVETIGQKLEQGSAIPYGEQIRTIAHNLARIPNGKIDTLLLGSSQLISQITSESLSNLDTRFQPSEINSFGQVIGIAETVSSRQGNVVTIYDELFEKAVRCYFQEGQEDLMRNMWGKRVVITGNITRDAFSGRPRTIRDISDVRFLQEPDEDRFLSLRGVLTYQKGDETSETIVRRFRDAF
ncbi:MAG: hypothetical protein H6662_15520 [Ardenticatenaceae bacterium]|nr:hypothetical protein [Anaerolineales bacterium]MCB8922996.1 hypothetical protein [Ardenticatenaceae bacterium]MCB8990271.1 hypothetical protein [Ardenticatenaceae bacterium]